MRSGSKWGVAVLCGAVALVAAGAGRAQTLEIERHSEEVLAGKVAGTQVRFSARIKAPELIGIEVELTSRTRIEAEVDHITHAFQIRSVARTAALAPLTAEDLADLRSLQEALGVQASALGELLTRVLLLLSEYPAGSVVDLESPGTAVRSNEISQKSFLSLCAQTGQQRSGRYTVGSLGFRETVQLGPCYNAKNECMGRCGPGCSAPPISTVQVFTQGCLDHDLCTRRTGEILGECSDEWVAASDDFLFSKDCARLLGQWQDNYTYVWNPRDGSAGVTGKVNAIICNYSVLGSHNGAGVNLVARTGNSACCPSFTYSGRFRGCHRMSGTWTNGCGLSGSWSMNKILTSSNQATVVDFLSAADLAEADTPACRNP